MSTIALVAHDNEKQNLCEWAKYNKEVLKNHNLVGTGTTSAMISEIAGLEVKGFLSGPEGGDAQIAAQIVDRKLDYLVFFWDPKTAQPHDPDVKMLMRIATLYNVPIAINRATADILIGSALFHEDWYQPDVYKPKTRTLAEVI